MWKRRAHLYLLLVLNFFLLNSNMVSKLISTATEWIVLSCDTPNYTKLPLYFPKTEIENWVNIYHKRGFFFNMYLNLFVLLYADDTVLMSETAEDLKKQYDVFYNYSCYWHLKVNVENQK